MVREQQLLLTGKAGNMPGGLSLVVGPVLTGTAPKGTRSGDKRI